MNDDQLELIERRLAESVSARVRPALFRVYAAMGTAVIAVLGFVGWDIVADIKAEIKQEIKQEIEGSLIAEIKEKRQKINELVVESQVLAKQTNRIVTELDNQLKAFEPQATQLDETIKKVESLNVDAKNIAALYSTEVEPLLENVQVISGQLKELAVQVNQLNALTSGNTGSPGAASIGAKEARGAVISSVITETSDVEKKLKERNKITVFFQFAGAPRHQAEELSLQLKQMGYTVPGEDRESGAAGKHEVRYFHAQDEDAAEKLAGDATRALTELGYPDSEYRAVEAASYVAYRAKKPREGVIELWLELPALSR